MVYDAFKAHTADQMKAVYQSIALIISWCSWLFFEMSTTRCLYKQTFKGVLHNFWEDYVADILINLSEEEQNSEKFTLPSQSRQAIVNWVTEGFSYLQNYSEMIENTFSVCGITTHNPQKVTNDEFLRSIMQNVNEKIHQEEEGLLEECNEGPFYNM